MHLLMLTNSVPRLLKVSTDLEVSALQVALSYAFCTFTQLCKQELQGTQQQGEENSAHGML